MIHEAFAAEVLNILGNSTMSGTIIVCANETKTPPAARITMTALGLTSPPAELGELGAEGFTDRGTGAFYAASTLSYKTAPRPETGSPAFVIPMTDMSTGADRNASKPISSSA